MEALNLLPAVVWTMVLSMSILSGLSQQDPAYVTWLRELIAADPHGAMGPKALLRHVTREPYMRCPWKMNDDLPGIRSMEVRPEEEDGTRCRLYPNPTNGTFQVLVPDGALIQAIRMYSVEGCEQHLTSTGRVYQPGTATPGVYLVVIEHSDGHVEQLRLILSSP
ncbi:MAG TPA: T9SS type A sorting domain-containing protein [Flavobacteriales bacterium]|nr:T9SS type A sorting domain-containing protein [Flavobacteriales bacterium]HQW86975.1 T9SS type A sorting domain-containing protein [Flavobacteriales bacterium]